jgi:hypothetical protein
MFLENEMKEQYPFAVAGFFVKEREEQQILGRMASPLGEKPGVSGSGPGGMVYG